MTSRPMRSRRLKPVMEFALVGAAVAFVLGFYYWTIAANNGFDNWKETDYFRLMVRGWMKGQLHMDITPNPALLALPDPYDPTQNGGVKLGDASLYQGRYYVYFGPAPAAILLLPYRLITGSELPMGAGVFVFASIAFLAAVGLFLAIRRRYFPTSMVLMAPLGVLALGFGTHLLALAQRPMIWELPIAAGIAFTMLALVGCYRAMHGRHPGWWMALAGLSLGLAVGSRPTCLFAAPLLLAPIWLAWRDGAARGAWWRQALAAAIPLGLCGLALAGYNYARFHSPFEFGQSYQLSGAYEGKLTHFALRFLPHNLYVYFFQPFGWTWELPFAQAQAVEVGMPADGYMGTEEVGGIAVSFPFVWFGLALPLAWRRREAGERRRLVAVLWCIAGYAVPVTLLILSYFSTCARYQADFAVAVGLLAVSGMLGLERWTQLRVSAPVGEPGGETPSPVPRRRRWPDLPAWVANAATLACAVTVAMGIMLGFDYHARTWQLNEPLAWQAMDRGTHMALARIASRLGLVEGPRVLKVRWQARPVGTIEPFWRPADARAREEILVRHTGDQLIQFGYARGDRPVEWGRDLRWERNHTHTVELQLPSLYSRPNRWASELMRRWEFRERTAVAVWFSGGRALGLVTTPWPGGIQGGGAVAKEFSGEVRRVSQRIIRQDEVAPVGLADPHAPRGGTLRTQLILPHRLAATGEPLFATGVHYESSIVYVRPVDGGVQFLFHNYAHNPTESQVVPWMRAPYEVEIELPCCEAGARFGERGTGNIVLRVNGREVLRTVDVAYGFYPTEENYGKNPFGTTCASEFRGWMLDTRWSAAETLVTSTLD